MRGRTCGPGRGGLVVPSYARAPKGLMSERSLGGTGLFLRGVVLRVYPYDELSGQTALYCDVLVYSGLPRVRAWPLQRVLVTHAHAGMHSGDVEILQPTTRNVAAAVDGITRGLLDPADMDGDHVIVSFLDDNRALPFVVRCIPHPKADHGIVPADSLGTIPRGYRMRLSASDLADPSVPGGMEPRRRPRLVKHNGSFFGVDEEGGFVLDTRRAHQGYAGDGTPAGGGGFTPSGVEVPSVAVDATSTPPGQAVSGNVHLRLAANATLTVEFASGRKIELRDVDGNLTLSADTVQIGPVSATSPEAAVLGTTWQASHASYDDRLKAVIDQVTGLITTLAGLAMQAPTPAQSAAAAYGSASTPVLTQIQADLAALKAEMAKADNLSGAVTLG